CRARSPPRTRASTGYSAERCPWIEISSGKSWCGKAAYRALILRTSPYRAGRSDHITRCALIRRFMRRWRRGKRRSGRFSVLSSRLSALGSRLSALGSRLSDAGSLQLVGVHSGSGSEVRPHRPERNLKGGLYVDGRAVLGGGIELPSGKGLAGELVQAIVDAAQNPDISYPAVSVNHCVKNYYPGDILAHQL